MLSTAGAQTLRTHESTAPDESVALTNTVTQDAPVLVSALPPPTRSATATADQAPRTLRLRSVTAGRLRQAWLEAKRDDVLLTAQDFASDLVDEALMARRRRRTSTQA
jgi:hypothetical protein